MAKRKSGKKGCLYFDKRKGKWIGKIRNGVSDDGKLKYKCVYGKTQAEVERKLTAFETEREKSKGLVDSDKTLLDYVAELLESDYNSNSIVESTYTRRLGILKCLSKYFIMNIPIRDIKRCHIEIFISEIVHYSQSMIDKLWQTMYKAFEQAVWDYLITRNPLNPAGGIKKPKSIKPTQPVTAFTLEEEKKIVDALIKRMTTFSPKATPYQNCYATQLLLGIYTGLRIGEINALTFEDIDMKGKKINVEYTVTRGINYRTYIGSTKTAAGNRKISIDDNTYQVLQYYLKYYYPFYKDKCIVVAKDGKKRSLLFPAYNKETKQYKCVSSGQCNDSFKRLCKKLSIEGNVHVHMLRHTYATRCIESGMSAQILQKLLGHTDIGITLNTYCEVFEAQKDKSLKETQEYLSKNALGLNLNMEDEKKS